MNNLLPVTLGNIVAGSVSCRGGAGVGRGREHPLYGALRAACRACPPIACSRPMPSGSVPPKHTRTHTLSTNICLPPSPPPHRLQLCMATVYSLLYGSLGRKVTGEAKTA